jgi:RNA polymerase sigma-70 factor (ECF subfamily)
MDFNKLLDAYEKRIYNLIFRLIGDSEEAADLTQETFISAYRSYSEFLGKSTEYTWLYRIAINKCKNRLKERARQRDRADVCLGERLAADDGLDGAGIASGEYSPDKAFERKELKERIIQAMSELPPDYRVVSVLRDLHGLSYQEIAQAADLSVDVVRTRLARARGMLRKKLEHYLDDKY